MDAVADEDAGRAVTVDCANAVDAREGWVTASWSWTRYCFCDDFEVCSWLSVDRPNGADGGGSALDSCTRTVCVEVERIARSDTA